MKIVSRPRRGGKTEIIANWLREDPENRWVLTPTQESRRTLINILDTTGNGYLGAHIVTPDQLHKMRGLSWDTVVAVDETEAVLLRIIGQPVELATFTNAQI